MGVKDRYNGKEKNATISKGVGVKERYAQRVKYNTTSYDDVDENYVKSFINDSNNLFSRTSYEDDGYSSWSKLNERADRVKGWVNQNKDKMTDGQYKSINDYLSAYDNASKQYSQFADNDSYTKYLSGVREREGMLSFDLETGKSDIESLESQIATLQKKLNI